MEGERVYGSGPQISFAIPYFSGLGHLREAIESVLRQQWDDWELVVVDDYGPEPAEDLVASFDDARISYVRNERNLGLGGNWNRCLELTRAPLVTVLHADDRLLPEYAGAVLSAADAHPEVAAVFTDVFTIDSYGVRRRTITDHVKSRLPRPSGDHVVEGSRYSASLAAPVGLAPAYETRGWGLNPEEYAIGTRAPDNARSKARLKSRWLVNLSRPRLA